MQLNAGKLFCWTLLAVICYRHENYWREVWWDPWAFLTAAMAVFASYRLTDKFHWSAAPAVGSLLLSAVWAFGSVAYVPLGLEVVVAIGKVSAYSFAVVLGLSTVLYHFRDREYKTAGDVLAALCIINSMSVIFQWAVGAPPEGRGGVLGNPSISGCFIAFTYPLLVMQPRERLLPPSLVAYYKRLFYLVTPIVATFLVEASQPVAIIGVVVGAYFFARAQGRKKWAAVLVPLVAVAAVGVWLAKDENNNVFSSSGRAAMYELAMSWLWAKGNFWTGQGTGATQVLMPLLINSKYTGDPTGTIDWWLWLHSDWLQVLFENGVVGLVSIVVAYGFALYRSYFKAPWLFAAVVGLGATACFNFPAHFPIHAASGAMILAMAMSKTFLRFDATVRYFHHTKERQ